MEQLVFDFVPYSSKPSKATDEYATPPEIFQQLDDEFHFTLDPCSTDENCKCKKHYTIEEDGLTKNWGGEVVFCNPPYSEIKTWVEKCFYEAQQDNTVVVMLIPAWTETRYFHQFILHRSEIRFVRGRVKFNGKSNPPFPNMIVIFRGAER